VWISATKDLVVHDTQAVRVCVCQNAAVRAIDVHTQHSPETDGRRLVVRQIASAISLSLSDAIPKRRNIALSVLATHRPTFS